MALGLVNKIFGALFGTLKVALVLSFLILFFNRLINHIPFVKTETLNKSVLYKPVAAFAPYLFPSFVNKTDNKDSI
jgi:membrane protein required for colicin V production